MRIIGEFDAGQIKVTVFKMNERVSIKLETGLLEQTYKFRDGSGVENVEQARQFCDEAFLDRVSAIFTTMATARNQRFDALLQNSAEEDVIL